MENYQYLFNNFFYCSTLNLWCFKYEVHIPPEVHIYELGSSNYHIRCIQVTLVRARVKSSQVKYIYIALFTKQIVSKLLHSINQDNITVFVFMKRQSSLVELINGMMGHLI